MVMLSNNAVDLLNEYIENYLMSDNVDERTRCADQLVGALEMALIKSECITINPTFTSPYPNIVDCGSTPNPNIAYSDRTTAVKCNEVL